MRSFVLAAACIGLAAPALADPALTLAPSNMRRAPNLRSGVVQHVPANAQIDVSNCAGAWCYASWRNLFGYVPAGAVSSAAPAPLQYAPPFMVAPPVVVGPAYGWGGPYVGFHGGYGWGRW